MWILSALRLEVGGVAVSRIDRWGGDDPDYSHSLRNILDPESVFGSGHSHCLADMANTAMKTVGTQGCSYMFCFWRASSD